MEIISVLGEDEAIFLGGLALIPCPPHPLTTYIFFQPINRSRFLLQCDTFPPQLLFIHTTTTKTDMHTYIFVCFLLFYSLSQHTSIPLVVFYFYELISSSPFSLSPHFKHNRSPVYVPRPVSSSLNATLNPSLHPPTPHYPSGLSSLSSFPFMIIFTHFAALLLISQSACGLTKMQSLTEAASLSARIYSSTCTHSIWSK